MSAFAVSRSVPSGTVTNRSPGVMIAETGWSRFVSKRRSRFVTMPTTRLPSTTGSPEIRCFWVSASTSRTVIVGAIVIGSLTTPDSNRLTFATSAACRAGRHVLVDDADPAFLRERDREPRLGDRIHRGRDDRGIERDAAGEPGPEGDFARYDERVGRDQQDVVEREGLAGDTHPEKLLGAKTDYTRRHRWPPERSLTAAGGRVHLPTS